MGTFLIITATACQSQASRCGKEPDVCHQSTSRLPRGAWRAGWVETDRKGVRWNFWVMEIVYVLMGMVVIWIAQLSKPTKLCIKNKCICCL